MADEDLGVMSNLAKKYINDHNNPVVKLEVGGNKYLVPPDKQELEEATNKVLEVVEQALKHDRVDRRCARAKGVWLTDRSLVKITKIVGFLASYGYQDKEGKFLYPEEALFLLETNRLELAHNDVPVSVQEAYKLLLADTKSNFNKYRVYKKLALLGYKLSRQCKNKSKKTIPSGSKRKLSDDNEKSASCSKSAKMSDNFNELFEKLRQSGPQKVDVNCSKDDPDYFVSLPTNSSKNSYNFKLIVNDNESDFSNLSSDNDIDVYATCVDNNVAFHRFDVLDIPAL